MCPQGCPQGCPQPDQVFLLVAPSYVAYVPCWPLPAAATPRTEVPSEDELRVASASTARRLRRKRAAERAKVAQAEQAPELSIEELRMELSEDPVKALQNVKGNVWPWSRNEMGCRLVQEALELGTREAAELATEMHGHVLEAVTCPHANYVIQKVVSHLSTASSGFVSKELSGNVIRVAKHRFACRILCRLLEFCPFSSTSSLMDELLKDVSELCLHNFAHHVVESVLENGEERHKKLVVDVVLSNPWKYATHKNSSYLVEKAICYSSQSEQELLLAQLGEPHMILDLALTQYGCYVARALIRDGRVDSEAALKLIAEQRSQLEATTHGQRFLVDVGLIQPCPVGQM